MRNYRNISSPDSWTYVYPKNIYQGLDADKPNLVDGVLFSFTGFAQGLGCRISDQTLWGVVNQTYRLQKFNTSGDILDGWNLYGGSNGAEIDGDNDDFLWVSTRFDAVAKYSISKRTDQAEVTYFNIGVVDNAHTGVNGICAPAGEFVYVGVVGNHGTNSGGKIKKLRKVDGVIVAEYTLEKDPSDLAWDGTNIWVSYDEVPAIDCFNPNDFSLVKTFNSPYPNNQGLTWDGENLWVSYPAGNTIAKLGDAAGSPASIYYATDTQKFYWNVNKTWEEVPKGAENFLANPDTPDSYIGMAGKYLAVNSTEDGLEFITVSAPPPPTATVLSIAKSGSAAMTGDIIFEAGANVTLTEDTTTKKITIAAAALEPPPAPPNVSSIAKSGSAAMTGDIVFEAGANVTLTEDTTTKKITIAAAALEPPPAPPNVSSIAKSGSAAMTGDIVFEAGANVTLTEDAATKKITIAAAVAASGDAISINGIPVNTDSQTDGYVLTYDAITGKILLKPKPTGGGGDGHLIGIQAFMNISYIEHMNAQYGIPAPMNITSSTILKP